MRVPRLSWLPVLALGLALGACTAEQTEEGNLPEYDIDPAEVEIGTDTQVVETPDIDIVPADPE